MKYVITILILSFSLNLQAQSKQLDSLVELYAIADNNSDKYDIALEIMESSSILSIEEARALSTSLSQYDDKRKIFSYSILADVYYYKNQLDSSLLYYLKATDEAVYREETKLSVSGMGNAAYVLRELGQHRKSLQEYQKALAIAKGENDPKEQADFHYNLQTSFLEISEIDSAIFHLNKAIDFDKKAGNLKGMCSNLVSMANLHVIQQEYDLALEKCQLCLNYAKELNSKLEEGRCLAMQSRVYLNLKNYKLAETNVLQALEIEYEKNDSSRLVNYYGLHAQILDAWGKKKSAINRIDQSIDMARRSNRVRLLTKVLILKAQMLIQNGASDQAVSVIEEIDQLNTEFTLRQEVKLLELRQKLALKDNNYKQAYEYLLSQSEYLNASKTGSLSPSINQGDEILEMYQLERENKLLEAQKESLESKSQLQRLLFVSGLLLSLLTGLLVYFWGQAQKRNREIERQQAEKDRNQLEFELLNKELSALRAQMNPHFLFNSLSSINDFIMHEDPRSASNYLAKFSHLMRMILNNSKEKVISLANELEALDLYIEMENLRLNGKLSYELQVDEKLDSAEIYVPSMIIQPYVENSIKHGIAPKEGDALIQIKITDKDKNIEIRVIDDGIGREASLERNKSRKTYKKSLGMSITKDRLKLINDATDTSIKIIDHEDPTGTEVILTVKKRLAPESVT